MFSALVCRASIAAFCCSLAACATINGEATQKISIQTVDSKDRVIEGMSCKITADDGQYVGVTPMFDMTVRRSAGPLLVECRREGMAMARAIVISRATGMTPVQMLLPGGSSLMVFDHLTGYMYSYPRWIRLRVGSDMQFDRSDDKEGRLPTPGVVTREFDTATRFVRSNTAPHHD